MQLLAVAQFTTLIFWIVDYGLFQRLSAGFYVEPYYEESRKTSGRLTGL